MKKLTTIYINPLNKAMGIEGRAKIIKELESGTELLRFCLVKFETGDIKRRLILR